MLGQATGNTDSLDSPWPKLGGSHHLPPYSILCVAPPHPHPNGFYSRNSQGGVLKLSRLRFPKLWELITPSPSFDHNLCCICPNDSCKAIFDIYTSRPFQRYKEHFKARCFDLCNQALKLQESRRTPSSHF